MSDPEILESSPCVSDSESYLPSTSDDEGEEDLEDVPSTSKKSKRCLPHKKIVKKRKISDKHMSSPVTKSKSKFTKFFNIIPGNDKITAYGLCILCKNKTVEIKMKNRNTSGLKKHLENVHKNEAQQLFPPKSSKSSSGIAKFFDSSNKGKSIQVSLMYYGIYINQ